MAETVWKWKAASLYRHKSPVVGGCLHAWRLISNEREWRWKVISIEGELIAEGRAAYFHDAKCLAEQAWRSHLAKQAA